MEKKITKKERFVELLALVGDNKDLVGFINHEIELLDRKNSTKSGKMTAAQKANAELKDRVLSVMTAKGKDMTVTEIVKEFGFEFSSQKISAMLKQMIEENSVERKSVKGVAYFGVKAGD